ncbi:MAG: NAD(P)-dependent oxidoreductase, partial [Candidatus Latescibacteria bacterium]|nr:NAD(P)-dependent oxidoreductase [Candidatus Latescibacterota bacterium]
MRILVTGAAGRVGSTVAKGLLDRHEVRGHDRVEIPYLDDTIISELDDFAAVLEATRDIDAIAHIGGLPGGNEWEPMLQSNFIGTYNVFEAARQNGVKRIAYASRAGVLGLYPRSQTRTMDMTTTPVGIYTVSKVFAEALAHSYAHQHDMETVCIRIGNFKLERDQPEHPHHLSHGDCVRVFEQALTHPGVKFEIVFGVSGSNWPLYD